MILASHILLWVAVIVLAALVAALARQVGILHERIAPAGALTLHQSVTAGDVPNALALRTAEGGSITIGGKRAARSQLLFFAAPDCPMCKSLLPVLRASARAESDWLDVVIAGDGQEAAYRRMLAQHDIAHLPLVLSETLGRSFGVAKLPYAVLLDEGGRVAALGLVNSREHLESLFEAKERGVASLQDFLARREGSAR